jgi:hypothetical protein
LKKHDPPREPETKTEAAPDGAADMELIKSLPKEVGVLLLVLGMGGLLLPGPLGSPFLLMGGVVLWPSMFERLEFAFQRRFPRVHRQSMRQLRRFIDDLERRYPTRTDERQPGHGRPAA